MRIEAPKNFSFINNGEELLRCFQEVTRNIQGGNKVFLDLAHIERLTPDAIAVLLAFIKDKQWEGRYHVGGSIPSDPALAEMFKRSGFDKHTRAGWLSVPTKCYARHVKQERKVSTQAAAEACALAIQHCYNDGRRAHPIYPVLIECMANTKDHAGAGEERQYEWWLVLYTDPDCRVASFTFIDLGVGIFDSINVKGFRQQILKIFDSKHNLGLVDPLLKGEIGSRFKRRDRGKGMPKIHSLAEEADIRSFHLITNNIFANLSEDRYSMMKETFRGTLFYFELAPQKDIGQ